MKKVIVTAIMAVGVLSMSQVGAFNLSFPGLENVNLQDAFSQVHFTLPDGTKNNFQGGFFWYPTTELLTAQTISGGGTTKSCTKKLRGLYYTNAKGGRVWPLDDITKAGLLALDLNGLYNYNNLTINGGLFTTCGAADSLDVRSVYGQIAFSDSLSTNLGSISAGLMYDVVTNKPNFVGVTLFPTLQYFNNQTPLGYVYDSSAGIGFIGGYMDASGHAAVLRDILSGAGNTGINNIFTFTGNANTIHANTTSGTFSVYSQVNAGLNTLWNISVLGNVLLGRGGLSEVGRQSILGNPISTASVVFSDIVNTSDILNSLRKNADDICRGQPWLASSSDVQNRLAQGKKIICVSASAPSSDYAYGGFSNPIEINLSLPATYNGVEYVVRGKNVVLSNSVPSAQYALNLFVDNGNVLLKNENFVTEVTSVPASTSTKYMVFNAQGKVITDSNGSAGSLPALASNGTMYSSYVYNALSALGQTGAANYGKYIRGNIFVNGLILGTDNGNNPADIDDKYYVHGKIASLNTALDASTPRKQLIQNIFTSQASLYLPYIDFPHAFSWSCSNEAGTATAVSAWPCRMQGDNAYFAPLVLMSTPISTKLFK